MSWVKSDGAKIKITFDRPIVSGQTGQQSFFTVTVPEYTYVPGGTLQNVAKTVKATLAYSAQPIRADLSGGSKTNVIFSNGEILLKRNDYVLSGLKMFLDAEKNTKSGHSSDATTWENLNGSINNGAVLGATWQTNSLSFDGTNDWVNCGALNVSVGTLEAMVEFNAVGGSTAEANAVVGNWQAGGWGIQQKNAKYATNLRIGGTWYHVYGDVVSVGTKIMLQVTFDGQIIKFYQNGVLKQSVSASGAIDAPASSTVMAVGSNPNGTTIGTTPLNGKVYSVRIYDTALTADEITANYEKDSARYIDNDSSVWGYSPSGTAIYQISNLPAIAVVSSEISWEESTPTGTGIVVSVSLDGENYSTVSNLGAVIPPGTDLTGKNIYVRIVMSSEDVSLTPTLSNLLLNFSSDNDSKSITLEMEDLQRFESAAGDITVAYDGSGTLQGAGGSVSAFEQSFAPTDLIPKPDQNDQEHIDLVSIAPVAVLTHIYYTDVQNGGENIEIVGITGTGVLTNINDL